MQTNEENFLHFWREQIFPWFSPGTGGCSNRSTAGCVHCTWGSTDGREWTGRQTATGGGTLHTSTPETSIHTHPSSPYMGWVFLTQPHFGQTFKRYLFMRNFRWKAMLDPSTLDTKHSQANNSGSIANDIVMEEDEASEVSKCNIFQINQVLWNLSIADSWRGFKLISILLMLIHPWRCHLFSSSTWKLSLKCP